MTKQEEIREGIALYIAKIMFPGTESLDNLSSYDKETVMYCALEIMEGEAVQGVVIKKEDSLSGFGVRVFMRDMQEAGYVAVEPLIEECND